MWRLVPYLRIYCCGDFLCLKAQMGPFVMPPCDSTPEYLLQVGNSRITVVTSYCMCINFSLRPFRAHLATAVCPWTLKKKYAISSLVLYILISVSSDLPSLHSLLSSVRDQLTPRGLTQTLAGTNLADTSFVPSATETFLCHDVYVWHGQKASPSMRAIALAKGVEVDRHVKKNKNKILYQLFRREPKVPISSVFNIDLVRASTSAKLKSYLLSLGPTRCTFELCAFR